MDQCEVRSCCQFTGFAVIYGGRRACGDCFLRHCDESDEFNFKTPGTFVSGPAVFTRKAAADTVTAAPAGGLFQ